MYREESTSEREGAREIQENTLFAVFVCCPRPLSHHQNHQHVPQSGSRTQPLTRLPHCKSRVHVLHAGLSSCGRATQ